MNLIEQLKPNLKPNLEEATACFSPMGGQETVGNPENILVGGNLKND
jgi:hypothetical protein